MTNDNQPPLLEIKELSVAFKQGEHTKCCCGWGVIVYWQR